MLDKFGLIPQNSQPTYHKSSTTLISSNVINNKEDIVDVEDNNSTLSIPSLFELMKKGYTKAEPDVLLILIYHASNGGKDKIDRQKILDAYRAEEIYNSTRGKNLSQNLNALIKASYLNAINKTTYVINPANGLKQINDIVNGLSTTKTVKPRGARKKKVANNE